MTDRIEMLLQDLDRAPSAGREEREAMGRRIQWLRGVTAAELDELFDRLLQRPAPADPGEDAMLGAILHQVLLRQRGAVSGIDALGVSDAALRSAVKLYGLWGEASTARGALLCLLTWSCSPLGLSAFAESLAADPARGELWIGPAFGPLFQHRDWDSGLVFPRLLDGLDCSRTAGAILDLANFVTRERMLPAHPAAARREQLALLLGALVGRLARLDTVPPSDRGELAAARRQVDEGVALVVGLCDALAQIGDRSVVGKLYQALELGHRRVRAEAAWALARLGESAGEEALVELAAEPVVRLRVLRYAEELGISERIDAEYRSPLARAEAELALWLSQPSQVGVPPTRSELIEERRMAWPGFAEPVDCFLFRYVYAVGGDEISNLALAGPVTHAFAADLADLPPDDIFAAFLGWHAVHEEIYDVPAERWQAAHRVDAARLERRLRERGFDAIQPVKLAMFVGGRILVASASRDGRAGPVAADESELYWMPKAEHPRPLGTEEVLCIFKGRKLLQMFQMEEDDVEG